MVTVWAPFRTGLEARARHPVAGRLTEYSPQTRVLVEIAAAWTYRKTAGVYPSVPGGVLSGSGEVFCRQAQERLGALVSGLGLFFAGCKEDYSWKVNQHRISRIRF